jgi:hypothetical protein
MHACAGAVQGEDAGSSKLERRIDEEVARVREASRADVAALREEARTALERETRLLRDMRDSSALEAERLQAELKDCRRQLDEAAAHYRALQHKSDVHGSSLAAELKIMSVGADRAQVWTHSWLPMARSCSACPAAESTLHRRPCYHRSAVQMLLVERDTQLQRLQAQNDLLTEKVRVLTESLFAQDAGRRGAQRGGMRLHAGLLQAAPGGESVGGDSAQSGESACDAPSDCLALDASALQVPALAAQCHALEAARAELLHERDSLRQTLEATTRGAPHACNRACRRGPWPYQLPCSSCRSQASAGCTRRRKPERVSDAGAAVC